MAFVSRRARLFSVVVLVFVLVFVLVGGLAVSASLAASEPPPPKHLAVAIDLVSRLDLDNTTYNHGDPDVTWQGSDAHSFADCSGFVDELLKHTYGYDRDDFKKWFDSHRPSARRYHDAIAAHTGFHEVETLGAVRPGDFIAVDYLRRTDNTGHIMLVVESPRRMPAKKPMIAGTVQWEVAVIDSSMTGHGTTDTRHKRGPDGKDHEGLGEGVLRLYTDAEGRVAGLAWSTETVSKFETPESEHVVIGRLVPGFRP
jgi:hypothetical protein